MARRTLAPRGEAIRLVPSWRTGLFRVDPAGEVLLPDRTRGSRPSRSTPGFRELKVTAPPAT